ncbi:MAG: hypothetical protein ACOX2P_08590 [Bacillota bacterium]
MDNTVENQILSLVDDFIDTMIELHNTVPGQEQELYETAEKQLLELIDKALFLLGGRQEYLEAMLSQLISQKIPQGTVIESFGNFKEELDQVLARALEVYREGKDVLNEEVSGSSEDWVEEVNEEKDEGDSEEPEEEEDLDEVNGEPEEANDEDEELEDEEQPGDGEESVEKADGGVSQEDDGSEETGESADGQEMEGEEPEPESEGDYATDSEESSEEDETRDPLGLLIAMAFPGEEILAQEAFGELVFDYYLPNQKLAFFNAATSQKVSHISELALRKMGITVIYLDPDGIYNIKSLQRQIRRIQLQKNSDQARIFNLSAE